MGLWQTRDTCPRRERRVSCRKTVCGNMRNIWRHAGACQGPIPGSMCSGWFVYFLVAQTRLQAWIQGDSGGDTPARKHAHAHGSQLMNVRRCCGIHSLSPARTRAGQHYGAVLSVLAASLGAGAVRLPLRKNNAPAAAAATATITARMVALEGIMACS